MARKVFISFLGTNKYVPCHYYDESDNTKKSSLIKYVQIALLNLYARDFTKNDQAFFFLTKDAKSMNWKDDGQFNPKTQMYDGENIGLETELEALKEERQGDFTYDFRDIKEGFSEEEVWEIFDRVTDCVEDDDEIILDITHAFRSIPMLGMVMINYLKAIKNVTVRGIYYGAFEKLGRANEVKKLDTKDRNAPIVNLKTFSELQDWTIAVDSFVRYGKTDRLSEMLEDPIRELSRIYEGGEENFNILRKLVKKLNDFTEYIETNRGPELLNLKFSIVKAELDKVLSDNQMYLAAYEKSLHNIKKKLGNFDEHNRINFIHIANWCREHGLIQQGITVLKEGITTYFVKKYDKDIFDSKTREKVDWAIYSLTPDVEDNSFFINPLQDDEQALKIAQDFKDFVWSIRNDINHNGMRPDLVKAKTLKRNFDEFLKKSKEVFSGEEFEAEYKNNFLLNLSNHPSRHWPDNQKQAAEEKYGELEDLSFPKIDPDWSTAQVQQLAEEYAHKVRKKNPAAVHIMGEMTFVYQVVWLLKEAGIPCIASTTERAVSYDREGKKVSSFRFVQFRSY